MLSDKKLETISKLARYNIIEQTYLKKSGHLGGALSCTDILVNIFELYWCIFFTYLHLNSAICM